MQVTASVASSRLQEAAAAAQKAQHQLASLESSVAAFAEAQQEAFLLQQVSKLPTMPLHCNGALIRLSCLYIAVMPWYAYHAFTLPWCPYTSPFN